MIALLVGLVSSQAVGMLVDEFYFHRRRGLPRWERLGHPIDTLSVWACYAWVLSRPPTGNGAVVYVALAAFSTLLVTKDEGVHTAHCGAAEHWLHSVLFSLHPLVLLSVAALWPSAHPKATPLPYLSVVDARSARTTLAGCAALTASFGLYQFAYWNIYEPWRRHARQ